MVGRSSSIIVALVLGASGAQAAAVDQPQPTATTHQVLTIGNRYIPGDASIIELPPQVIFEGDSLVHRNQDTDQHDLLALDTGPDGRPHFKSPLISSGESASVPVENLQPGVYGYTCSIHPFMRGTLEVKESPLPSEEEEPPTEVSSGDSFFSPKTVTIKAGTTVRWTNNGQINHTVTAADGSWDSHPMCPSTSACWRPGETYSRTFTTPGVVPYYCKLHGTPGGSGHAGTVVVLDPASTPTAVSSLGATVGAGSVSVTGSASFGGEPRVLIAEDGTGDPPLAPDTAQFGVDLETAHLSRPDPAKNEIEFVWKLARLDSEAPPEVVRYLWQMKIADKQYWVQAKTTDFLSGTNVGDDPPGHVQHLQGAFKLRGNCGPIVSQVPNVTTCRHVAWVTGTFDAAKDEVRLQLPLGQSSFPEFVPGATIQPFGVIEAGFQAGISNSTLADQVANSETPYRIAQKEVAVGIAPAGTALEEIAFSTPGTLAANDGFTGSLSTAGLAPGTYDVWAKACFGGNCGTRKVTITL